MIRRCEGGKLPTGWPDCPGFAWLPKGEAQVDRTINSADQATLYDKQHAAYQSQAEPNHPVRRVDNDQGQASQFRYAWGSRRGFSVSFGRTAKHRIDEFKKPNILLITVDCLRADHIGLSGHLRDITPNIDNLAATGINFREAVSQGGSTPFSFPALLASLPPPFLQLSSPPEEFKRHLGRAATLAEVLQSAGYSTAAFHSNPYLSKSFGYDRGFTTFEYRVGERNWLDRLHLYVQNKLVRRSGREVAYGRYLDEPGSQSTLHKWMMSLLKAAFKLGEVVRIPALAFALWMIARPPFALCEEITTAAIQWLRLQSKEPWFLWVHYMDAHAPYPAERQEIKKIGLRSDRRRQAEALMWYMRSPSKLTSKHQRALETAYDACIHRIDASIGKLLRFIDDTGMRENTLVALTADHGETFGEHGTYNHGFGEVLEPLIRVPLVLEGPRIRSLHDVQTAVPLWDLPPTLLGFANVDRPDEWNGRDLTPFLVEDRAIPEIPILSLASGVTDMTSMKYSCRIRGWKYVRWLDAQDRHVQKQKPQLFNLAQDPHELDDKIDEEPERAQEMGTILDGIWAKVSPPETTDVSRRRVRTAIKQLRRRKRLP